MEIPSGVKPGLWGAAAGAIAMAIVGFSYLGWTTEATAQKLAQDTADTAVVIGAGAVLRHQGRGRSQPATLTKFQAEQSSYSRSDIVMKAGWATLGGQAVDGKTGSDALARACAEKLHVVKAQLNTGN